MKTCPFCAESIQDDAIKCRYCGEFLNGKPGMAQAASLLRAAGMPTRLRFGLGYEYKSSLAIFGLPLVHIASGVDETGRPRVARGIIALGNIAVGVLAFGGIALGGLTFGGMSVGLVCIGGLAVGGIALGGLAVGVLFAAGGMAVSLGYAVGGGALAPCAFGGSGGDSKCFQPLLEKLEQIGAHLR
jgi:hypothetical protein